MMKVKIGMIHKKFLTKKTDLSPRMREYGLSDLPSDDRQQLFQDSEFASECM